MTSNSPGAQSRNPYGHLTPIRSMNMFFGRDDSLTYLFDCILDKQCVAITGPRRVGKSSLLVCSLLSELPMRMGYDLHKHLLILVDLEEHLQKTPDDFFDFVSKRLVHQSKQKKQLEVTSSEGKDGFSQLLDQINEQGLHPVLLLDEFDSVVRNPQFNPDFFLFLRAQANAGRVSYVTASFSTLDQICHPDITGSPFFNIFTHHSLGPLSRTAAIQLITAPSAAAGSPFNESEVQFVLKMAGRHPFYVQRTCYFLFQEKRQSNDQLNTKRLIDQVYDELLPHFIYAWKHLLQEHQEQLKAEAIHKDAQIRKIPELSESSLFRRFVLDKAKISAGELTTGSLRSILDKLDDFKFLGECPLSNLNIIYSNNPNGTLTQVERGIRSYEILQDALSQLKTSSAPGEVHAKGQTYDILMSCYFKKDRRSQKQRATFFGMSERNFYRERDTAVTMLLNIILKMEASYLAGLDT